MHFSPLAILPILPLLALAHPTSPSPLTHDLNTDSKREPADAGWTLRLLRVIPAPDALISFVWENGDAMQYCFFEFAGDLEPEGGAYDCTSDFPDLKFTYGDLLWERTLKLDYAYYDCSSYDLGGNGYESGTIALPSPVITWDGTKTWQEVYVPALTGGLNPWSSEDEYHDICGNSTSSEYHSGFLGTETEVSGSE